MPIEEVEGGYKPSGDEAFMNERQRDYFRRKLLHPAYCLVWLDLFDGDAASFIRAFLKHRLFGTNAQRMGVIARVHPGGIDFWKSYLRQLTKVPWIQG